MPEREVGMENEGRDRGKDDTSNEGLAPPGERRKDWWKKLGGYQSAESPEQHGAIANGGSEEEPSRDRHQGSKEEDGTAIQRAAGQYPDQEPKARKGQREESFVDGDAELSAEPVGEPPGTALRHQVPCLGCAGVGTGPPKIA